MNKEGGGEAETRQSQQDDQKIDQPLMGDAASLQELTGLIQGVLQQTQDRFQSMSDQIIRRIDDMTKRIDDLEKNITDLMTQAGVEADA